MCCLLRKTILFLMMAALLLSGCGQTQEPTVPETEPPETTVPAPTEPAWQENRLMTDPYYIKAQTDHHVMYCGLQCCETVIRDSGGFLTGHL